MKINVPTIENGQTINLEKKEYNKFNLSNKKDVIIKGNGAIISGFQEYSEGQKLNYEPEVILKDGDLLRYSQGETGEFHVFRDPERKWYITKVKRGESNHTRGLFINDINNVNENSYAFDRENGTLKLTDYGNVLYSQDHEGVELLNCENIVIEDFTFMGFNRRGVHTTFGKNITFRNCTFLHCGWDGIIGEQTSQLNLINCVAHGVLGNGFYLYNNHDGKIENCKAYNIGMQEGRGEYTDKICYAPASGIRNDSGNNVQILNNEIKSCQYNGIGFYQCSGNVIKGNKISNTNLLLDDGGGIYCWGRGVLAKDFVIENNEIENIIGTTWSLEGTSENYLDASGIYVDDNSSNGVVKGNKITNVTRMSFVHNADSIDLINNVGLELNDGMLFRNNRSDRYIYGCEITGNTINSKGYIYKLWSQNESINIWDRERNIIDNNNITLEFGNFVEVNSSSNVVKLSFAEWVNGDFGQDKNSKIIEKDDVPDIEPEPEPEPENPIPGTKKPQFDIIQSTYKVFKDDEQVSSHTNIANAIQEMVNIKLSNPNSEVRYETKGRIEEK